MISQSDLTTLGRKLYTAFERKAGKIDIVNRGVYADLKGMPRVAGVVELVGGDEHEPTGSPLLLDDTADGGP